MATTPVAPPSANPNPIPPAASTPAPPEATKVGSAAPSPKTTDSVRQPATESLAQQNSAAPPPSANDQPTAPATLPQAAGIPGHILSIRGLIVEVAFQGEARPALREILTIDGHPEILL